MKKILGLTLAVVLVIGLVAGGTWALFSDTETTTGNVFTAGTIDISLNPTGGQDVATVEGYVDLKPCQTGYIPVCIHNDGTNPCEVWKHIANVENSEHGIVDAEAKFYAENPGSENWLLSNWIHYDLLACKASVPVPVVDGVLDAGEWGTPLCVGGVGGGAPGTFQTVTVYAYATTGALYLAFDTGDVTDNRGGAGLDVLDWNIGLVGSDFNPAWCGTEGVPWRYALRTKVQPDNSWGVSWDAIDGYHGCWEDTWNPNTADPATSYYHIPGGIEMVTSFGTGHRVTEFKIPLSLLFDGTHGWNPACDFTLMLGGTYSGEDSGGNYEMLWWPAGIDHCDKTTYAELDSDYELVVEITEGEGFMLTGELGVECNWIYLGILEPCQTMCVIQSYHLDIDVGNWGQSDRVFFDMEFLAQQVEGEPEPPEPELTGYERPQ